MRAELRGLLLVAAFLAVGAGFYFAPRMTSAALAVVLCALAGAILIEDRLRARNGLRATGRVVDHERVEGAYVPVVEFTNAQGATQRLATGTGTGRKRPAVGTQVVVVYDVTGAHGCEIDTYARRWGTALALALLGGAFALGAWLSG